MIDVVCLGEILIDMTPRQDHQRTFYEPNPGGAPANVAVAIARLGKKAAFVGSVGDDFFGQFLRETLLAHHVDIRCLHTTHKAPTTLAFVHLDGQGERSFSFYRSPGADLFLPWGRQEQALIAESRLFHFGSLSMTTPYGRKITRKALEYAKKKGKIISFDPNLRPSLWKNLTEAKKTILSVLPHIHILKVSEEELSFLSGKAHLQEGISWAQRLALPFVIITRGKEGVICLHQGTLLSSSIYEVEVIDTTGAGDAFVGGFLSRLLEENDPCSPSRERLLAHLRYASAVAALTVSRRGAIPALPSHSEVENFMASSRQ
ncbi:MAG: carbohydrate kinase [Brevinematales bacterium]|nr:carbohydrate kinase [Brevinematales bacterium]